MKKKFLLVFSISCFAISFVLLVMKTGYPYHRALAGIVYAVSLVTFFYGYWSHVQKLNQKSKRTRVRMRQNKWLLMGMVVFAAGGYILWVLVPVERSALLDYSDSELHEQIRQDRDLILTLDQNLQRAYENMINSYLFATTATDMTPDRNEEIRTVWQFYVESMFELDVLKERYKGFAQIPYHTKPELHARAFGIAFGAYIAQYRATLYLDKLVSGYGFIQSLLNEADHVRGIPQGTYLHFQRRTVHPRTLLRYWAGIAYLRIMEEKVTSDPILKQQFAEAIKDIDQQLRSHPQRFIDKPLDLLESRAFERWLPVQKNIALGMSHIRFKQRPNLISSELIDKIHSRLKPGDIMVQRRNWYATNLGIPGYWPHAALYIGTLNEMDESFEGIAALDGLPASNVLKQQFPDLHKLLAQPDSNGSFPSVIEAIAPGVVFTTLKQSAAADCLSVLRPVLSKEARWQAIVKALTYHGKPYDYNFDFATDNELVCSELVFKAYSGADGFDLETKIINGRPLMPPNDLVIKFDREFNMPDPQLELVVFLDGRESQSRAVESDATALRKSWKRPKWYLLTN